MKSNKLTLKLEGLTMRVSEERDQTASKYTPVNTHPHNKPFTQ